MRKAGARKLENRSSQNIKGRSSGSFLFFCNSSGLDLVVCLISLAVTIQVKIRNRKMPFSQMTWAQVAKLSSLGSSGLSTKTSAFRKLRLPSFSFSFTSPEFIFYAVSFHHRAWNSLVVYSQRLVKWELMRTGFQHCFFFREP